MIETKIEVEENWNDPYFKWVETLDVDESLYSNVDNKLIMARDKLFRDFHYTPGDITGGPS